MAEQVMITLIAVDDVVVDERPLKVELLELNVEIRPISLLMQPR